MRFLGLPSPSDGLRDLRRFFAARRPHELLALFPALGLTMVIVYMLFVDYSFKKPYERNIIYAESWPLNRSDAEIRAAQLADQRTKKFQRLELKIPQNDHRQQFKKIDDWLTARGI